MILQPYFQIFYLDILFPEKIKADGSGGDVCIQISGNDRQITVADHKGAGQKKIQQHDDSGGDTQPENCFFDLSFSLFRQNFHDRDLSVSVL